MYLASKSKTKKIVRITKNNSISVSGNKAGTGASATHIDTAVFDLFGTNTTGWEVVRLANGGLSKAEGLPTVTKLHYISIIPEIGANAAGSDYIYMRDDNKIYRAGATGNFTEFSDGGKLFNGNKLKKFLDRGFTPRTNNRGEFAVAAEDENSQHWIIELDANGKKLRSTKAAGKLNEYGALYYVDF